jgi:hypothetical protein
MIVVMLVTMRMTMTMTVVTTAGLGFVALVSTVGTHMLPDYLTDPAAILYMRMPVAVTVTFVVAFVVAVVMSFVVTMPAFFVRSGRSRVLRVRCCRIKGMRKIGSYAGLPRRIIRVTPALALEMKCGG